MRAFFDAHAALERKVDERFGILASVTVNVHRQKGMKAVQPGDFFPNLAQPVREQTAEEMRAHVMGYFGLKA